MFVFLGDHDDYGVCVHACVHVCVCACLCLCVVGILIQGGGRFDTFVSSFYLQFSTDGNQWFTYKELITDARPKAKVLTCVCVCVVLPLNCNLFSL